MTKRDGKKTFVRALSKWCTDPSGTAVLFVRSGCPHCARAQESLGSHKGGVCVVDVSTLSPAKNAAMIAATGHKTVPRVFMGAEFVGGADELAEHLKSPSKR